MLDLNTIVCFILMLLVLFICVQLKRKDFSAKRLMVGLVVAGIALMISGIMYENNIEECEVPEVSITRTRVICAKDNSLITGEISGGILHVQGSVSEKSVYQYYYQLEDGGIKQGKIPVDTTTIYFVKSGEEAYLETIVTTEYSLDNNNTPATRLRERSETTYKLYVPENSIINTFELNAK